MALFKCENCNYSKTVEDKHLGKKTKCPKCQTPGTVADNKITEKNEDIEETQTKSEETGLSTIRCPHCDKIINIEELNLFRLNNLEKIVKNKIKNLDTEKAKENISKALNEGRKHYLYIFPAILILAVSVIFFTESGISVKINNIVYISVAWSALFVFFDSTRNGIGKISGKKSLLNNSPMVWSIGTLLL
jgi:hypothetical protein